LSLVYIYFTLLLYIMSSSTHTNTIGYLSYIPYFDAYTSSYYNVICINDYISGPLGSLVKHLHMPPISSYKNYTQSDRCYFVLQNHYSSKFKYYTVDQLESLFLFMKQNKYIIHHEFYSQHIPLAHNHICMFSYSESS
jgi:hypothetical protein